MYPAVKYFIRQHTALKERRAAASILEQEMAKIFADASKTKSGTAALPRLLVDTMVSSNR